MKPLRNPWVVAVLAILILAVVGWQMGGWAWLKRWYNTYTSPGATARSTNSPPAVAATTTNVATNKIVRTAMTIDRTYIDAHFRAWVESPRRDPFRMYVAPKEPQADPLAAAQVITLYAVWRQTGARLATLNSQVLGEGDVIEGFTVDRIESDQVWVRGARGVEPVYFGGTRPALPGATNRASATPPPTSNPRR